MKQNYLCFATFLKILQSTVKYKYRAQKALAELLLGHFADKADVYISDKMVSNLVRQKNNIHE